MANIKLTEWLENRIEEFKKQNKHGQSNILITWECPIDPENMERRKLTSQGALHN